MLPVHFITSSCPNDFLFGSFENVQCMPFATSLYFVTGVKALISALAAFPVFVASCFFSPPQLLQLTEQTQASYFSVWLAQTMLRIILNATIRFDVAQAVKFWCCYLASLLCLCLSMRLTHGSG
jgi:hypothetical protein